MTPAEFIEIQDDILGLSGKALAELIGAEPSSISGYRNGRTIPDYIAKALGLHAALKLGTLKLTLSIDEILALSVRARTAGLPLGEYITSLMRKDLDGLRSQSPARPFYAPEEIISSRLNDDEPPLSKRRA